MGVEMIAAFDVHYLEDGCASAAAVLFKDYGDPEPEAVYTEFLDDVAAYIPGEFYKRELPCLLLLLEKITEPLDEIIIDGYVMLGNRPGLGQHLYNVLGGRIPVIGVAKNSFKGSKGIEIFRGTSKKPLYATAAGLCLPEAYEKIRAMHGSHRIPTLLKRVDFWARKNAREHIVTGQLRNPHLKHL